MLNVSILPFAAVEVSKHQPVTCLPSNYSDSFPHLATVLATLHSLPPSVVPWR